MTFPTNAKKVYQWKIYTIYEREQKLYDGTSTIFEWLSKPDVVKIIATVDDKIIITEETQPHLDYSYRGLLWGRMDHWETPIQSAQRELLEETWMISQQRKEFSQYSMPGKIDRNTHYFIAQNCQKIQAQKLDAGEKIKLITLSFDEFIDFVTNKASRTYSDAGLIIDFLRLKSNHKLKELQQKIFN